MRKLGGKGLHSVKEKRGLQTFGANRFEEKEWAKERKAISKGG